MDKLQAMKTFVRVVEAGSFSAVAHESEAVERLSIQPDFLLVDAMHLDLLIEQQSLIKGDARSVSIAAASILAKVERDALMRQFDLK